MALTKITNSMTSGAVLNILDFGAIPDDNTKSAINKTAMEAAIAYAVANNVMEINVSGVFYMDGDIVIPNYALTISGQSSQYRYYNIGKTTGSNIIFTSGTSGFNASTAPPTYPNSDYFCLRDITLDGNSVCQYGVLVSGAKIFQNVTIQYFTVAGITLADLTNSTLINQSSLLNNGIGLQVLGQATTVFSVTDTNIRTNTVGIEMQGGKGVRFQNCVIESNTSYGLHINVPAGQNVGNITFERCWFENNNYVGNIQQVRIEGTDPVPDIYMLTFSSCLFDVLTNTSGQDFYIDGGTWTRFDRCQFSNDVITGVVLTTKCKFTQFFNCERGANDLSPLTYITANGYATTINENNHLFVGPNLLSSQTWTNVSYGTFSSTGNKITNAISTGAAGTATLSSIARGKGQSYALQIYIEHTSGELPTLTLTNGDNTANLIDSQLTADINTFYFTETVTGSSGVLTITNSTACNWRMYVDLIEYETVRGYIQYDNG
jgi:hypothetical protein